MTLFYIPNLPTQYLNLTTTLLTNQQQIRSLLGEKS